MVTKALFPPIEIEDVPPEFKERRISERRIRDRYQQFRYLPDEWERSDTPCDCYLAQQRAHNKIIVELTNNRYLICPGRYYIFIAWKAVWEKKQPPSEELWWELMGHDKAA